MTAPDSSGFWPLEGYEAGKSQPSYDKQFVRDWLKANPDSDYLLPDEIIEKTLLSTRRLIPFFLVRNCKKKMTKEIFTPHAMAKMAMCVALISIGGYIAFPTPFSPVLVTATTLALGITALVLPPKQTAVAILVWILLGAVGIPVLSGGQGGIG